MKDKASYMSPETMQKVIDTIPQLNIRKWVTYDIQMLFKILYWIALRPSEGIRLSKEDFDLVNREVYLGETKTEKEAYVTITKNFIHELELYLNTKENGRLFPGLTYNTFYPWLVKLGKLCNVPAWTIPQKKSGEKTKGHIFRKSVGKDMYSGRYGDAAKLPTIISEQLRHKDTQMTFKHYLKLSQESVKEAW